MRQDQQVLPQAETGPTICPAKLREYFVRQMVTNPNGMAFAEDPTGDDIYCRPGCAGPKEEIEERSVFNPFRYIIGAERVKEICPDQTPVTDRQPPRLVVKSPTTGINEATSAVRKAQDARRSKN